MTVTKNQCFWSFKQVIFDFVNASKLNTAISVLSDQSTFDTYGDVYKFTSVRLASMNNVNDLLSYSDYRDRDDINIVNGDRVFVDNVGSKWKSHVAECLNHPK